MSYQELLQVESHQIFVKIFVHGDCVTFYVVCDLRTIINVQMVEPYNLVRPLAFLTYVNSNDNRERIYLGLSN